ncbi:DUF4139 domain-containing protein [Lysobacter sp. A378]
MHRTLSLLVAACALAACSQDPAPRGADALPVAPPVVPADKDAAAAEAGVTQLSIYSGAYDALAGTGQAQAGMPGYALVERPLHYTLTEGLNSISATSVPPSMDVEAALLRPKSTGVSITSQRYIAGLQSTQDVIAQMIGHRIVVEHTAGNAKQTDTGVLLAANAGLTLAMGDGRVKVISDYDNFSVLDGTRLFPQQAELRWTVRAQNAGDADFLLSYPMGGMAWRAEYVATLDPADAPGCKLALDGAAMVINRAGVGFADARLTLIAGEPNRAPLQTQHYARRSSAADTMVFAEASPMPEQRTSAEYHAYQLPDTVSLSDGGTERFPLFAHRAAIACERAYVVDAGGQQWQPPTPLIQPDRHGQTGTLPVNATVSVDNAEAAGLGQPLPAGRIRVFDGADFLGESMLHHTPAGADIRLEVGKVFDLSAEREATDFKLDRAGRTITESFAIVLGNAKKSDATIEVVEQLPRWSDWEIVASSVPATKKDANHVEFQVPVAAGGESRLTYTVRYRWSAGDNP